MFQAIKSSQVSPSARRRAQCKGGGGKEKNIYNKKCQTLYSLQASLNPRNTAKESPIGPHFSQQFPNCKALYLQNISNFVSQICWRPRGGYVGRGFHAGVLLTQCSAGKFAM